MTTISFAEEFTNIFKIRSWIWIAIVTLISSPIAGAPPVIGPWLQDVQSDRITIMLETETQVEVAVYWGSSENELTQSVQDSVASQLHTITINGLAADQVYFYQCRWNNGETVISHFITAPADELTKIRIAAYGDSRSDPEEHKKIIDQLVKYDPQIVIHTGDLVANGKKRKQWPTQFFNPARELLKNVPIYPILGNHERNAEYYYSYFPIHQQKGWWSTNYGPVHIIGLHYGMATGPDSEQYRWLENDLKSHSDRSWIIAIVHYPLFHVHPTRPIYDIRYQWQPLFEQYGVDLVLSGHDHYYHRSRPIGHSGSGEGKVVHITTAGGGAPLYKLKEQPYTAVAKAVYHFMIFDISKEQISGQAIDDHGIVIDRFTLSKFQDLTLNESVIDFGVMEFRQNLANRLGRMTIKTIANNKLEFTGECDIGSELSFDSRLHYEWRNQNAWQFDEPAGDITLIANKSYPFHFRSIVPQGEIQPTPILQFTIESPTVLQANSSTITKPLLNNTFSIPLEEAAFNYASRELPENINAAMDCIQYFNHSDKMPELIDRLATGYLQNPDLALLARFDELLESEPGDYRYFYLAPFYFLNANFTLWDKWIESLKNVRPSHREAVRRLIEKVSVSETINTKTIKKWNVIGPFDNLSGRGLDIIYAPEQEIDFTQKYSGMDDQQIDWQTIATPDGWIDFFALYHPNLNTVAYAYTQVEAVKDGRVLFLLGSDDAPVLWVNGEELHRLPGGRSARKCQDLISADLKKGSNTILLKVDQGGGEWEMILQITDKDRILVPGEN